jgi:Fe-S cluster assembly protein SufD
VIGDLLQAGGADTAFPAWLQAVRGAARSRVELSGLPGRKLETWRYSGTKKLLAAPWVYESGPLYEAFAGSVVGSHTLRGAVAELVFVNGVYSPSLSHIGGASGLTVEPLSQSFASRDLSDRLTPREGARHGFDALNAATVRDGVFIDVAPGAEIREPVHLIFVTVGEGAQIVCQPRVVVQVGSQGGLTLVERHVGTGSEPTFTNIVSDVSIDDGASLTHHL